jgi:hypothetical protein
MAIAVVNANLAWQQVFIALDALGATPAVKDQFRALKQRLATVGGNKQLLFVAFSDLQGDTVIAAEACTFYGAYGKKQATATDAYFKTADHASVCGAANGASACRTRSTCRTSGRRSARWSSRRVGCRRRG